MKYDEVIEAIKDSIKYKKLMADAGGGGGGAGAGGGAAGGSGGATAGGSATSSSGDGGSAEGSGSDATPSADSTSSEPTTSRGGYFAGYGGYWGSKGSSKKKKKKKAKVGTVKDGIYEGDVIDAQDKFKQKQTKSDIFAIHIYTTDASGKSDWIKPFRFRDQYEVSRNITSQLKNGVKPEHIKVEFNGKFINMPEFGITENMVKKVAGVGILTALLGAGANAFLNKLPDQQAQADLDKATAHANLRRQYRQDIRDEARSVSDRAIEIAHEMGIPNNPTIEFKSVGRVPVEINGIEVPAFLLTDKEIEQIKKVEKIKAMMKGANEGKRSLPESATIEQLEDKLYKLEGALGMARRTTKDIKYVDTHIEIMSKLAGIAEDVGLELDKYDESKVLELKNELESAIYQLEEPFEDAIRDIQNQIDELEYEEE